MTTILNGKAAIIAADCNALSPVSPPASNNIYAIAASDIPQITLTTLDGHSDPNEVCIPSRNVAESAEVIKNDETSMTAMKDRIVPNGSCSNTANN